MKLVNSKDIKNLLEDKTDPGDLFLDGEDLNSPCWEVKVDRDNDKLLFLIDNELIYAKTLSHLDPEKVTLKTIVEYIGFLKVGKFDELKTALND